MSDSIIKVEHLSKRYVLNHQAKRDGHYGYVALRDVLSEKMKAPLRWLKSGKQNGSLTKAGGPSKEEFWALNDVSFEVKRGECVGIIGRNGAGKSTLLKILSRITEPSSGRVVLGGRVASLLEVGTGFHPELTGRENIFLNGAILGMTRVEIRKKFDEIVAFAEVEKFLDTPVKRYSSGMYVRLAFAVAAHLEPEILIADEVLAVGDAQFQKKCLGKMKDVSTKEGRTVIFVSHNMGAVTNLCTRGIVLIKGKVDFDSTATSAVERYLVHGFSEAQAGGAEAPHMIYRRDPAEADRPFSISSIGSYDIQGNPKPIVATGDQCILRIEYDADHDLGAGGALVLQFNSYDGAKVLLLSTTPDSGFPVPVKKGRNILECIIEKLPFGGGEWSLGAGVWSSHDCLCWTPNLCVLQVEPGDPYGSGVTLRASRTLISTPHTWRVL
jgi:lipopolysaccharide transport system ATP-binding protein